MNKIYTGIGSRSTPPNILTIMNDLAYYFASQGYTLRSGKAGGADEAFQLGAQRYYLNNIPLPTSENLMEIYIPWNGFRKEKLLDLWDIVPSNMKECQEIAATLHPAWAKCSQGAKKLHARNVCQVLGYDLNTPSDFVIFYAPEDKNGNVKGGTQTAVKLARQHNIPCVNMLHEDWKVKLRGILKI